MNAYKFWDIFTFANITLCTALHKSIKTSNNISISIFLFNILLILKLPLLLILIMLCGDVEMSPGPETISQQGFSFCHWNVNSIFAHNFTQIFLLKAYVAIHKFDIICLSETYLNLTIATNNDNLDIDGYNLVHPDHPSNTKPRGVCICYRSYFPLQLINII